MNQKPVGSPRCFGEEFSASEPECAGGPDPAYIHPSSGAAIRDKCGWFSACAPVSASNKAVARQQLIPPQNLVRPVQIQGPPRPAQSHAMIGARPQFVQQQQQPQQMAVQQQMMMQPHQQYMVAPVIAQYGPQLVPMMTQQPGAQMSHYLTVPEPVNLNEHPLKRLMREIGRSMLKSAGHTGAAFFDHNPWRPYEVPRDEIS